jgi:hypothetical protein
MNATSIVLLLLAWISTLWTPEDISPVPPEAHADCVWAGASCGNDVGCQVRGGECGLPPTDPPPRRYKDPNGDGCFCEL